MNDLFSFLGAVADHWVALMSGVVSLFITLLIRIRKIQLKDKPFWFIAAFFFFLAFFLAWRDERVSFRETEQQLSKEKDQNAPKLSGHFEQVIIREHPEVPGTQIFIDLSIRNLGGTSIAENFLLNVKSADFQYKDGPKQFPTKPISLLDEKKSTVTIVPNESMDKKTAKPIVRGDRVRGWLMFFVDDVKPEIIRRPNTQLTISFNDVLGQSSSVSYDVPQPPVN